MPRGGKNALPERESECERESERESERERERDKEFVSACECEYL